MVYKQARTHKKYISLQNKRKKEKQKIICCFWVHNDPLES